MLATAATDPHIYRHRRRRTWGRAVQVWETPRKVAYQFEDGGLRVFRRDFVHLLEAVEVDAEEGTRLRARLRRSADRAGVADTGRAASSGEVDLDARVAWFLARYPGGFGGERWLHDQRGQGARTRRAGHRDPSLAEARDRLVPDMEPEPLARSFAEVVAATDLVGPRRRKLLVGLDHDAAAALGRALAQLLTGEDPLPFRFERWLDRVRVAAPTLATWAVSTAPLALLHPDSHPFVRRTTVRREATLHGLSLPTAPSAPVYTALGAMFGRLGEDLAARGTPPADLFDLYDFVRLTLSPAAQRELAG